jgi:hypothetical protein
MASGQILLILNKVSEKLNLEWCPLLTWVFITNTTNNFILQVMSCASMMHPWI